MHPITLDALELGHLHEAFSKASMDDFRSAAPAEWRECGFMQRYPLVLSIEYGQDMSIDIDEGEVAHRHHFACARRYNAMKYISFAVATHIRYVFSLPLNNI
jgi:hypothetical protein